MEKRDRSIRENVSVPSEYLFKGCEAGGKKEFWDLIGDKITMTNVIVRLGLHVPWIFSDPLGAHSNYWTDDEMHWLIACGANDRHSGNKVGVEIKACKQ